MTRYITQSFPVAARISHGKSLAPAIRENVMRRKLPEKRTAVIKSHSRSFNGSG